MKAVVTGVDVYRWYPSGTPGDGPVEEAQRGDAIEVSEKEFNRVEGALTKPDGAKAPSDSSFPTTHAELDALAAANDFSWPKGTENVADKHAALTAAGITVEPS